ncbi:SDR family oxidoreductase [Ferrimonas pelagia]|uniref:SDR family oxidoreductase n=1 Tax=Ferrimonas pelagia TaxID=1177826 RepID=A0ABP9EEC8_9GAMM
MYQLDILKGRVAYISGGTSGINLGIAKGLSAYGAKVVVIGRNSEKAQAAAEEIRQHAGGEALAFSADVRDFGAVMATIEQTREHFGPPDIVIAGAAGNFPAPASNISANGFKTVMDIDLQGTFNVFRAAYEHCNKPGSSFIAITAEQAVKAMPFQSHVGAAKAGINMLVKDLALEWGREGIRVNCICPGPINDTEGMRRLAPTPEIEQMMKARISLGDLGDKEDIANAVVYLCSPLGRYITGTVLDVDGGCQLGDASMNRVPQMKKA